MAEEHTKALALCDDAERADYDIDVAREAVADARLMADLDRLVDAITALDRARKHRAAAVTAVCSVLHSWWRLASDPSDQRFPHAA